MRNKYCGAYYQEKWLRIITIVQIFDTNISYAINISLLELRLKKIKFDIRYNISKIT